MESWLIDTSLFESLRRGPATWRPPAPRRPHAADSQNPGPLHSSSKRLMRILGAIVEPTTGLLAIGVTDLSHRRRVSAKPVGHDLPRSAVFLHDPLEKLHRRGLVPASP